MTSNIVTMICKPRVQQRREGGTGRQRTVTMTETMVSRMPAMAEMMELMAPPMAEKMEP